MQKVIAGILFGWSACLLTGVGMTYGQIAIMGGMGILLVSVHPRALQRR
jgi:hypothetical protein